MPRNGRIACVTEQAQGSSASVRATLPAWVGQCAHRVAELNSEDRKRLNLALARSESVGPYLPHGNREVLRTEVERRGALFSTDSN